MAHFEFAMYPGPQYYFCSMAKGSPRFSAIASCPVALRRLPSQYSILPRCAYVLLSHLRTFAPKYAIVRNEYQAAAECSKEPSFLRLIGLNLDTSALVFEPRDLV